MDTDVCHQKTIGYMHHRSILFTLLLILPATFAAGQQQDTGIASRLSDSAFMTSFRQHLEKLRTRYHIPGISVGIVHNGHLAWSEGLGFADVENKRVPDAHTTYQIASVTKTFGAVILLQLAYNNKLSLDDPISRYGINLGARWGSDPRIRLKHLLTHTAMGGVWNAYKPGYQFRYNGAWYQELGKPIHKASGETFGQLLLDRIVKPLGMTETVPSPDDSTSFRLTGLDSATYVKSMAIPYDWMKKQRKLERIKGFKYGFGPAAGMVSNVTDLAKYAIAIDERKMLSAAQWDTMWAPFVNRRGKKIQYGQGWFTGKYKGEQVIWHTGWWTGYSALFLKVPSRNLTFIVLANSQDLSRPFYHIVQPIPGVMSMFHPFKKNLNKRVDASAFAKLFLLSFVR